jgi:AbrB family looped-hinge helix DNA binding protein
MKIRQYEGKKRSGQTSARQTSTVGERGTVVIPASLRRRFRLEKGAVLIAEATNEGVLLRPAKVVPLSARELEAQEDRHDAKILSRRAGEKGRKGVPWETLKKKHGL